MRLEDPGRWSAAGYRDTTSSPRSVSQLKFVSRRRWRTSDRASQSRPIALSSQRSASSCVGRSSVIKPACSSLAAAARITGLLGELVLIQSSRKSLSGKPSLSIGRPIVRTPRSPRPSLDPERRRISRSQAPSCFPRPPSCRSAATSRARCLQNAQSMVMLGEGGVGIRYTIPSDSTEPSETALQEGRYSVCSVRY